MRIATATPPSRSKGNPVTSSTPPSSNAPEDIPALGKASPTTDDGGTPVRAASGEFPATPDSDDERVAAPVSANTAVRRDKRQDAPKGWRAWVLKTVSQPIPGAQPRVRFDLPVEPGGQHEVPAEEPIQSSSMLRHPIYFGFMGTVGVGIALFLNYILANTESLLLWIVTALFIALGLDPVVRWLERRKVPRGLGIVVVLVALLSVVAIFFATLIPTITEQTTQLVNKAPIWIGDFLNSEFFKQLDVQYHVLDTVNEQVAKFFQDAQAVGGIFGGVVGVGTTIANGLFGTLIVLVLSLYFLASLPAIKRWGYRLAPRSRRQRVEELSEEITRGVGNYVIGQVCVAVLNAAFAFIVMTILNVPFTVLLAFLVALLAFIPLVGGTIAAVVVIAVSLTVGWQTALIYAICYLAYLQFEAYFISPRIMQKAVAVPGAVAVISVIAGGSLLGVLGALIAIPTAAAVMLLVKEVFIARQDKV
ncbi:AI-2E family transporter [Arthrobacter psychrolactophilus]|uniref:AI-2E family transporter n=1 Tax=Arthrobacter psychrolactophilus TaxID=92442 RepID=A0A2V5IZ29_9MICC|nr:AI-2E family transporter [Arthrobacter psychrolactophilus]